MLNQVERIRPAQDRAEQFAPRKPSFILWNTELKMGTHLTAWDGNKNYKNVIKSEF